jgi:hypothetical protein
VLHPLAAWTALDCNDSRAGADSVTLDGEMNSNRKKRYIDWLARYRWRWIGVMTFRPGLRGNAARRMLWKWLHDVELAEGRRLSWIAVPEKGTKTEAFHFHVLIAGIGSRLLRYLRLWNSLAGHCHLALFDRNHRGRSGAGGPEENRGVAYALKGLASDDYELDGQLLDEHQLVRYRRASSDSPTEQKTNRARRMTYNG